uniref:Uncharacterized protein n=1 Tax=Romanomermis culicivorax TaxID=13658 RepID=A0A915J1R5_ROMCU
MMSQTSYLSEIQAMMYAMGDCRRPLVETAVLLEQIVLRQLRSVYINGAMSENLLSAKSSPSTSHSNSSGAGGGNSSLSLTSGLSSCTITPQHCKSPFTAENLLTAVIRRDRNVAQRLIAYLKFNDLKFSFGRTNGETGEFLASIEADEEDVDVDLNEEESIASDETSIMGEKNNLLLLSDQLLSSDNFPFKIYSQLQDENLYFEDATERHIR